MDPVSIYKLEPTSSIPEWATNLSPPVPLICSITRTAEELSIVCPEHFIPQKDKLVKNISPPILSIENDWVCIKVEGILDFGLTGILSSLTAPLAEASISIFAISTYNTDYLLVKQDHVARAIQILEDTRQFVVTVLPTAGSGPVTSFCEDVDLVRPLKEATSPSGWPQTFGLVLVAGWPPPATVQQNYVDIILPILQSCFQPSDWDQACYIYPSTALHSTIATLWTFIAGQQNVSLNEEQQNELIMESTGLVKNAITLWAKSQSDKNDGNCLELELQTIQIGAKAAIIVWKDNSGELRRLREILRQVIFKSSSSLLPDALRIPDIIHTTVLRFARMPHGNGHAIQRNLEHSLRSLHQEQKPRFRLPIHQISFVCERKPFMHIPNDKEHVLFQHSVV